MTSSEELENPPRTQRRPSAASPLASKSRCGTGAVGAHAMTRSGGGLVGVVVVGVLVGVVVEVVVGVAVGVPVPSAARISIALTFGWLTDAVNARSSRPSDTGTVISRTRAVIGATSAFRSRFATSTGPPSAFTLNTRFPVPPAPPPVAPK